MDRQQASFWPTILVIVYFSWMLSDGFDAPWAVVAVLAYFLFYYIRGESKNES